MKDISQEGTDQVVFSLNDIETFGAKPQMDPKLGREFFMWDNMFPTTGEGIPRPIYTVQETAKLFFGRGSDWLRWRYRPDKSGNHPHGYFVLNGVRLEPKRTEKGSRYYTLADIERMTVALVESYAIDPEQAALTLQQVLLQARLHYIIGEPSHQEDE